MLISGGGSALLPAPVAGITLEDKLAVTRLSFKNCARKAESDSSTPLVRPPEGGTAVCFSYFMGTSDRRSCQVALIILAPGAAAL